MWKSLRDYFNKETKKKGKLGSGSGANEGVISTSPYYSLLLVLKHILQSLLRLTYVDVEREIE